MGLKARNTGGKDYELIPAGIHVAVCYGVIDLGTQETAFGAKEKFLLLFEVPGCRMEYDGQDTAMVISKEYTNSTHEKSVFSRDLISWMGRTLTTEEAQEFDLTTLVGRACQVQVLHDANKKTKKEYAKIGAIVQFPADRTPPRSERHPVTYELTENYVPEDLPQWIRDKIENSLEFQGKKPFTDVPETEVEPF